VAPSPGGWLEARRAVEGVVREHAGRVVAGLIRYLGDFPLAEDAFQDAVAIALERWPQEGVPANPAGWIVTSARRRALDRLRHRTVRAAKEPDLALIARLERDEAADEPLDIPDERLALMFTCCHPALSEDARVALTLRTLGGLSTSEIARSFLLPEATIAQRIVRAKRKIDEAKIPFAVPDREALPERVSSVLAVLYLVYNEGHSATTGGLLRTELSSEAIRLARVLLDLLPREPEVRGLLALMLLHDSRRATRTGDDGALVTLDRQDRTRWDRAQIAEGAQLVEQALASRDPGPYQLQAAIAALHAQAATPEATDWWQIVGLYTALYSWLPTPVVALNRAAALAMAAGPAAGLRAMDDPEISAPLADYHLLHSARADLMRRLGRGADAAVEYRRALALVTNEAERRYLVARLDEVDHAGKEPRAP
jgi:RNA polymerase sigma-70 factor (ECF subfamily)